MTYFVSDNFVLKIAKKLILLSPKKCVGGGGTMPQNKFSIC